VVAVLVAARPHEGRALREHFGEVCVTGAREVENACALHARGWRVLEERQGHTVAVYVGKVVLAAEGAQLRHARYVVWFG
jgi:hypothetical protein